MTRPLLRGLVLALGIATALGGCVVSSNPVIAPSDSTFDERLLGTWEEIGGPDRVVVTRGDSGMYAILFTDARDTSRLAGRLGRLGGRMALDLWPVPEERDLPSDYASVLLPAHVLVVVEIGAQEVGTSILDTDSLLAAQRRDTRSPDGAWCCTAPARSCAGCWRRTSAGPACSRRSSACAARRHRATVRGNGGDTGA